MSAATSSEEERWWASLFFSISEPDYYRILPPQGSPPQPSKTRLDNAINTIKTILIIISVIINITNHTRSRLHVPPLELRFQIYAHLLTIPPSPSSSSHSSSSKPPSHAALSATQPPSPRESSRVHPAILLANRQINWEATPFLYASNIFIAHPSLLTTFPRLRNWYPPLREAKTLAPRIRRFHVQVRLDLPLPFDREQAREAFSGLEELSVDVVQAMFLGVDCANLAVFEAVRGVKSVRFGGSTTGFEEYLAWLVGAMTSPVGTEVVPYEPASGVRKMLPAHRGQRQVKDFCCANNYDVPTHPPIE
ncbi:hypothetical protein TgHK011_000482 [Trichoderma gracile]|nr:hypothetical protein TgHK011_000482 [Trichoderma gracile]